MTSCNSVLLEAKHCNYKCTAESCTAEDTAVRDQNHHWTKTQ